MKFGLGDVVECLPKAPQEQGVRALVGKVVKVYEPCDPVLDMYAVKLNLGDAPRPCATGFDGAWLAYDDELRLIRRAPGKRYQRVDAGPRTL
jgi:hypothetical protein